MRQKGTGSKALLHSAGTSSYSLLALGARRELAKYKMYCGFKEHVLFSYSKTVSLNIHCQVIAADNSLPGEARSSNAETECLWQKARLEKGVQHTWQNLLQFTPRRKGWEWYCHLVHTQ